MDTQIEAEEFANIILSLSMTTRNATSGHGTINPLIKLPPVFTKGYSKYGDPKRNLIAMIRTLSEYSEGDAERLTALPLLYNQMGGLPLLNEDSMRRVHNWLQQVGFSVRAAAIEKERQSGCDIESGVRHVFEKLYGKNIKKGVFVTFAPNSSYQLKPLRYANRDAICRWITQEWQQRDAGLVGTQYGATPTPEEWESFGLRGQLKAPYYSITQAIKRLSSQAYLEDVMGNYNQADHFDRQIITISQGMDRII